MNLPDMLGYEAAPARGLHKALQRLASTRPAAWLLAQTLRHPDRLLFRLTGGRVTVSSLLAGLPVLMLRTRGAQTGRVRTTPLTAIPIDGELAVIGTNFGQKSTPAWTYNLEHHPEAEVIYGATTVRVVGRRADLNETNRVFAVAGGIYSGYGAYRSRTRRTIRVFMLQPAEW